MSIKVCFISCHFTSPEVYLANIIKMTPGRSGRWKDMEAVTDPNKADFCAIFDGANVPVPADRSLYFGEHPDCNPAFTTWPNVSARGKFPLDKFLNPGEWWLDYDYDYLTALKPPVKDRDLICVFTGHTHTPIYAKRKDFVVRFCKENGKRLDLYGRPRANFISDPTLKLFYKGTLGKENPVGVLGEHQTGKELLARYKYSLEFDVGPTKNYISERFYDALLLWTLPFYFGSSNVQEFIPQGAFRCIDMNGGSEQIMAVVNSHYYEEHLADLTEARNLLLNKYQIWPYVYDIIQNLVK